MKMNKLLAFGASLALVSSCACLPVSAENTFDFVVVGVSKDNTGYIVRNNQKTDFNIGTNQLEKYNPSIGEVQLGDVLTFENLNWDTVLDYGGIHAFNELLTDVSEKDTVAVSVTGSVFDNPEIKTYKVWGFSIDEMKDDYHFLSCSLADEKGRNPFDFYGEIDSYVYTPSDCVDWTDLQEGDTVSCIVYDNVPMFVTEKVSDITVKPVSAVTANGDA
ncbi:MAG: hypothetical protein IKP69_11120, partial [Oscillospiraceae bacterium]|nr:hypothetical protein [Oscillospiraceae bacterium]